MMLAVLVWIAGSLLACGALELLCGLYRPAALSVLVGTMSATLSALVWLAEKLT